MRTKAFFFTAAAFALLAAGIGPAGAQQETTRCTFVYVINLSPGLSAQPSTGTVTTNGRTGKMECKGLVNGQEARGKGAIGIDGHYGIKDADSCASGITGGGEGAGSTAMMIPTRAGDQTMDDWYTLTYGGPSSRGVMSGTFEGGRYSGTFSIYPLKGDCVSSPLTQALVTGEAILKS
jgi:hypothetical protein